MEICRIGNTVSDIGVVSCGDRWQLLVNVAYIEKLNHYTPETNVNTVNYTEKQNMDEAIKNIFIHNIGMI